MQDAITAGRPEVIPFPPERTATLDALRWARKRLEVATLVEVDVTTARETIRAFRRRTGRGLSFTAWTVYCVARAAAEHPRVHALRGGRRKLFVFPEVDIAVIVERAIADGAPGETLPMPCVIRNAHTKSPTEIHDEIRNAQNTDVRAGDVALGQGPRPWQRSLFFRLPAWCRDLVFWRRLFRNPLRVKDTMGTVVVSATGMAAPGVLAWGIPLSLHPLAVAVGGIARRPVPGGTASVLALTVVFDHAVTDGAPVGRFIHRLHELMTRAEGLDVPGEARPA